MQGAIVVINKYLAEMVGTFILVLFGSMAILGAGEIGTLILTVPFGFGLGLLAAIYAVGHVSGGHFNPAVTLAMFLDKRTSGVDLVGYWISQFVGGLIASLLLMLVVSRDAVANTATSFPILEMGIMSELTLTAVFCLVILASTRAAPATAGIAISLTLVAVHFVGIPFSGASVNPARSFAPAVVGGNLTGLWVYLVFPLLGAVVAWGLWQLFQPGAHKIEIDMGGVGAEEESAEPELPEPGAEPGI
jgi:aquaporin Z